MNIDLGKAIDSKLDRTKWKKWKFSDLVDNIVEKVKPQESGLEHYIGLEHLDSGSLHIKRFGESKTLIGDKLKIYKNDIIFAKRNAYLKRVSIAPFDAVASAHSMVLRLKSENVLPEFLPFFLLSEKFWTRAIEISVGSLSPTINWKSLAKQEFLLPPKDQQAKLAELLWAMDEVIERDNEVLKRLKDIKTALQRQYLDNPKNMVSIGDISKVYSGGTPNRKISEYWNGSVPWIKTAEVNYRTIFSVEEYISEEGLKNSPAKLIPIGSVLVAMYGQGVTRGRVAITGIRAACNQACAVIETSDTILANFIYAYLEYKYEDLRSLAHGANQQNLNLGMIKEYKIPDLELTDKNAFLKNKCGIDLNILKLESKISSSKALQKSLINQVF